VDGSASIRATGLQPNEHVSIRAELIDGRGENWSSQADFVADAQGNIDACKQAPISGSYHEVSAMGLVWSMLPNDKHVGVYVSPKDLGDETINFSLIRNGADTAHATLVQAWLSGNVREVEINGQLHGVLFLPKDSDRHPGVLVLGGSEGGAPRAKAAWLASHGYAAFALAYFRYEGLPDYLQAIPLEYFGQALSWMMQRQEIIPDKIAVMGTSRGGELALQLGSMYPEVKAVVAYVPSNVRRGVCCGRTQVRYAWTWKGMPLAFAHFNEHDAANLMPAMIQVEHTHGPILLISGQDDGIWDSSGMTNAIISRLKQTHFSYEVEHFNYDHAGHLAGRPMIVPAWHGTVRHPVSGFEENFGGNAEGDAHSSLAIPKVLDFLSKNLQTGLSQTASQKP
jgi:dienelactone hydrolase